MFTWNEKHEDPSLDEAIDAIFSEMQSYDSDSAEYARMTDQLEKLYKIKALNAPDRISADTMVTVGAHLAGILLIVGHERAHVVTSKALSFVTKLR